MHERAKDLKTAPPALRLLAQYLDPTNEWETREGPQISRILKIVGTIDNLDQLDLPWASRPLVRKFNATPVLIQKEARLRRSIHSFVGSTVEGAHCAKTGHPPR